MQRVCDLLRKVHMNMLDPDTVAGENVLLLGLSGAGKSSLLNTLNSALTGRYRPWLRAGQDGGQTNTLELIRFPKCGVREADLQDQEDDLLRDMLPKLPNFWDFAGLADDDNDELREILRLVIFDTGKVFVAITKQDLIDRRPHDYNSIEVLGATDPNNVDNPPMQPVSPHLLETRSIKDQLSVLFNMGGATEFTIVKLTNYNDVTGYEFDSEIVSGHLEFLYKLTIPKLQRGTPNIVVTPVKHIKRAMLHAQRSFYEARRRLREAHLHENHMIIIIVVAVLACFLGYSFSKLTLQK